LDIGYDEVLELVGARKQRTEPVRARWISGGAKPLDVVGTTLAVPLLISERVVRAFTASRFQGWTSVPVELRDKGGDVCPNYRLLCVGGRCGGVDNTRSAKVDRLQPGIGASPVWKGLYFDESTWDGSDVFTPEGTAFRLVVEPVKKAFEDARLKNASFTALSDLEQYWLEPP
jgi:hypothetical protein